ncbi:MAG: hypothetical protein JWR67_774 [Mucilaginibacter sp.]|nr:hypothetical protein [Mucilaginibacter sp.]MDB5109660.1 hypothetical protein [Mucilaginibacter sp.]
MDNLQTKTTEKKAYHSPELKDLGKIGEVTNTNTSSSNSTSDGGSGTYNS